MRIGQLAARSGLSRDTIRFYEKTGLLPSPERPHPTNTYKEYPPETLERLRFIQLAKRLGFTLREITDALDATDDGGLDSAHRAARLRDKLAEVDAKRDELETLRTALVGALSRVESCDPEAPDCAAAAPHS